MFQMRKVSYLDFILREAKLTAFLIKIKWIQIFRTFIMFEDEYQKFGSKENLYKFYVYSPSSLVFGRELIFIYL